MVITGFHISCLAQSYVECAQIYKEEYKEVQFRVFEKKLSKTAGDSLLRVASGAFDSCINGKFPPEFVFAGKSGKVYTNQNLTGKIVMLNIWSVRCGPCIGEIPVLNKIARHYRGNDKFVLLSVLVETEEQLSHIFDKFPTKRTIDYEVIPTAKYILKNDFQFLETYPTTLFLDQEGKVYARYIGGIVDPKYEEWLETRYRAIIESRLKN